MAALYDLFRTPQQKGETKVRYHARSVVTGKTSTKDLIRTISKRSAFKEGVVTGVLIALEEVLRDELAAGKSVQLTAGRCGCFPHQRQVAHGKGQA